MLGSSTPPSLWARLVLPEDVEHSIQARLVLLEDVEHSIRARLVLPEDAGYPIRARLVLPEDAGYPIRARLVPRKGARALDPSTAGAFDECQPSAPSAKDASGESDASPWSLVCRKILSLLRISLQTDRASENPGCASALRDRDQRGFSRARAEGSSLLKLGDVLQLHNRLRRRTSRVDEKRCARLPQNQGARLERGRAST